MKCFVLFSLTALTPGLKVNSDVRPIATFDFAPGTTLPWEPANDPVMGGVSISSFVIVNGLGIWAGQVQMVPALKSPGFCNLQAPGLYRSMPFPSLIGTSGIVFIGRQSNPKGLSNFNVQVQTAGSKHCNPAGGMPIGDYLTPIDAHCKMGVYSADLDLHFHSGDGKDELFVPWGAFKCTWRGEKATWCPDVTTQLSEITNIGLSTSGKTGPFTVEIDSISAQR